MEADARRKLLIATIFEKESFSEDELIQVFREKTGGPVSIGIGESIHGLLRELIDLELLRYSDNKYFPQHREDAVCGK